MLTKITDTISRLVVRFPGGMGDVNAYLIEGRNGYTIIDTGIYAKEAIAIWQQVFASGIKIEKVVLTHMHQDHSGLAKWFQETQGVPIYISKYSQLEQARYQHPKLLEQLNELVRLHGYNEPLQRKLEEYAIYSFTPDGYFEEGQQIALGDESWEVIWTPGHANDHCCFYQREKQWMIIGDHILQKVSPVIGLWTGIEEDVLSTYFASLEKMKQFDPVLALPGHGEIMADMQVRAEEIRSRHEHRLIQVLKKVQQEEKTANQVSKEIYGAKYNLTAFMAVLTRFLYLESNNQVVRNIRNGIAYFTIFD
ncbi:MBL fold metallo-hydrolase [Caldibacillus lycopersici]|uniref:MBL fold metallo-hydrolase n=1 Tax=Perspicuibacillus lycopersici TaxID=1325689 RepID=A0AAE3IUA5_9BACI|nr:MBL fold metallo-hydrolase [Perspicuibacillus lycopersici]MCU9614626.1 MBL fold metallo-hydrolase [Perspicuibacillus lycopersici]